jgi:hypothetical protein
MMISTFLDESYANPQNSIVIQNQLSCQTIVMLTSMRHLERSNTAGSKKSRSFGIII